MNSIARAENFTDETSFEFMPTLDDFDKSVMMITAGMQLPQNEWHIMKLVPGYYVSLVIPNEILFLVAKQKYVRNFITHIYLKGAKIRFF